MMNLINFRLRITLSDSRVLTGQMLAFDKHMNMVLADCEEFRKVKSKAATKGASVPAEREEKRTLGLVILRGEIIVSMSVDGPPPPSADDQRTRMSQLSIGSGVAAPAGRGMPVVPGAAPGLTGPVRGVGGPAPGMMLPRGPAATAPPMSYGRGVPPPGGIPPPGMPPAGFRPPLGGMMPPGMAPPPGFRPMQPPPGVVPPGFRPRPGMPPGAPPPGFNPGFAPGFPPGPPPPGFQPPPGFRPPPPGFRPPQ
ncbi:hypothetical protein BGZ98_008582 [Dissophora globulifera]|nr:hypothetical protein BGZ98_008582 [Dissophora globulifera]